VLYLRGEALHRGGRTRPNGRRSSLRPGPRGRAAP